MKRLLQLLTMVLAGALLSAPAMAESSAIDVEPLPALGAEESGGAGGGQASDETPEQRGRRIAEEARDFGEGFKWSTAVGRMILSDGRGNTNERVFESRVLEDPDESDDEGDRGILVFLQPPDVHNTALLTIGQEVGDDHQWLYLPAIKRVKRISASGKTGSFVGSEFTYEDLGAPDIDDYTYRWLGQEACPGAPDLLCNMLERHPTDSESGYSRIVSWQEAETYRSFKSDFYDRKGTLLKTLTIAGHKLYEDRFWRATDMTMQNHVTGKSTQMLWSSYDFDTELYDSDFTVRALERLQ